MARLILICLVLAGCASVPEITNCRIMATGVFNMQPFGQIHIKDCR